MKVTPIRFKDVRGKELLYIEIENTKGNKVLINVGKATLEGVEKLQTEEINEKPRLGDATGAPFNPQPK